MKALAAFALAAATLTLSAPASAQFAKAEDAIKYRQSALFVMGQHFGRLGAMANGRIPFDAKAAQENADVVAQMAKLPWAGFGAGTDKGAPTPRHCLKSGPNRPSSRSIPTSSKPNPSSWPLRPRRATWTTSRPHSARPPAPARHATTITARNRYIPLSG